MKITLLFGLLSFWSSLFGYDVKIRVVDDQGAVVSGASAKIAFVMFHNETDIEHVGVTDKDGVFNASGRGEHSVFVEASKDGYYLARLRRLPKDKDIDLVVVIPRILNPGPLYAWDSRVGSSVRSAHFPIQNEWLGYDFEAADWVSPRGKGKVVDLRFRFRNQFKGYDDSVRNLADEIASSKRGYAARKEEWTEEKFKRDAGKWDAELEISFPGEREGLFEEMRFLDYSALKLPHNAPVEGYMPTWRYTASSYSPRTTRENVGFFLRTRVKLDEKGKIVSANYAKVVGDFQLDARGFVMFGYYFNPTANDRNLEFDPKKNLFPANFAGANVNDP